MKTSLVISLSANLLLAAIAADLFIQWRNTASNAAVIKAKSSSQTFLDHDFVKPQISSPLLPCEAFQWNQLESADYLTYITNLRGIRCPEQTIRDIITADVHALYAQQSKADRSPLDETAVIETLLGPQRSLVPTGANVSQIPLSTAAQRMQVLPSATQSAVPTPLGFSGAEADAVSLAGRQVQGTGDLRQFKEEVGRQPSAGALPGANVLQTPLDTTARGNQARPPATKDIVSIPAAFASLDTSAAASLSEQQLAAIRDVRQQFQEEVGEPTQDPNDPAYRQRWETAQRNADEMLAAQLGWPGYLEHLMLTGSHFQD